ncbi:2-oxo-4-hydroxy-4-carboxy-5-ureidoimidazoline decarboxylase [Azospirillum melinis]|uniref:2-oxo-4-hydroxy-4-carboxy-5-ureidoimidazoline decarboxylase n=1 Tax=Azospirillum melinis TaxID=328839 RepID=A0ABX2KDI5_9PROT|nr:2-oxo-4-hydroxy-4-carboxy-5-ureidoimidazoline decarboxylase [Azospirillum melinis]MBP2307153.1 2-oxo-4-hydroxy-4-carboxy-5-ureidoimidazoline decarboxylase [Azospirillum melinis]NUB00552.1 2-oxo-4-hydroxy-4-carboxy-5-ureidoimidazoline decarboxylase [Azospirillum melinis]
MPYSLDDLNRMDRAAFVAALGAVFEESPWVAEAAWDKRPFADATALRAAMTGIVRAAGTERQHALILSHPDLADRASRPANLTAFSQTEQAKAGLNELTEGEAQEQRDLNRAYRERFGFPFIMAVRFSSKQEILAAMRERVANEPEVEFGRALEEIYKIAGFRLDDLVK